jgi:hypothetical protein
VYFNGLLVAESDKPISVEGGYTIGRGFYNRSWRGVVDYADLVTTGVSEWESPPFNTERFSGDFDLVEMAEAAKIIKVDS